jgi:capsular polysaccharide biosynthesis protein
MPDSLDAFRYMSYVRLRWRLVAASCATAVVLAGAVSLLLPREYTATARIVIEPPAGSDPRSAMAVSPIYLESLRTYEQFAASDSLFQKAAERFQLRMLMGARPIEVLKRSALKVGVVRNTRILEIAATLPDPAKAQALAQFVAEQTVSLNQSLIARGGNDLMEAAQQQQREAQAQLDRTEKEWSQALAAEPVDDLQNAIFQASQLRAGLEERIANQKLDLADAATSTREQNNARTRLQELQRQLEILNRDTSDKEKMLARRLAHKEQLEAERKANLTALEAVEKRVRETRDDLGYRGERLSIIDPGVVPERPSSPNISLNLSIALLLGLVLPLVYLALELSYQQQRAGARRDVLQALTRAQAHND